MRIEGGGGTGRGVGWRAAAGVLGAPGCLSCWCSSTMYSIFNRPSGERESNTDNTHTTIINIIHDMHLHSKSESAKDCYSYSTFMLRMYVAFPT